MLGLNHVIVNDLFHVTLSTMSLSHDSLKLYMIIHDVRTMNVFNGRLNIPAYWCTTYWAVRDLITEEPFNW